MRRPAQLILAAALVVLAGTTAFFFVKYRKTSVDYADMKSAEQDARSRYAEAFNSIAEIQDSLNTITLGDSTMQMVSQQLTGEQRVTEPNKREALDRIALLSASIQRTKERIHQLEASLKKSGTRIAGLERMITSLKRNVTEREEQVAALTTRVDSLQTTVTGLATEVQQAQDTIRSKDETITEKQHDLATIYYLVGTKQDLSKSGVIVARGGLLGIGKTLTLSGQYNESLFTPLDTDQETSVPIPAAKVEILSGQPTSSYQLTVEGGQTVLRITDPTEFRKFKHLVIMTKQKA